MFAGKYIITIIIIIITLLFFLIVYDKFYFPLRSVGSIYYFNQRF